MWIGEEDFSSHTRKLVDIVSEKDAKYKYSTSQAQSTTIHNHHQLAIMLSRTSRPLQKIVYRLQRGGGKGRTYLETPPIHSSSSIQPFGTTVVRHLSTTKDTEEKKKEEGSPKESLQDTVRRMQQRDGSNLDDDDSKTKEQVDDFVRKARDTWSMFSDEVSKTWDELLRSGESKDINKKLIQHHPEDTVEGDKPYTGSVDIMIIDETEQLTAWERMQRRLAEAPIISGTRLTDKGRYYFFECVWRGGGDPGGVYVVVLFPRHFSHHDRMDIY